VHRFQVVSQVQQRRIGGPYGVIDTGKIVSGYLGESVKRGYEVFSLARRVRLGCQKIQDQARRGSFIA
jgi:hypothetical protein